MQIVLIKFGIFSNGQGWTKNGLLTSALTGFSKVFATVSSMSSIPGNGVFMNRKYEELSSHELLLASMFKRRSRSRPT